MRWIVIFLLLALGIIGYYLSFKGENKTSDEKEAQIIITNSPTPEVAFKNRLDVSFNNAVYRIFFYEIPLDDSIKLIPNFSEKESGEKLAINNNCKAAINGGFYQESGKPLGLFYSEGSQAGKLIQSNLITGFFWQDNNGDRFISREAPLISGASFILQTGPIMHAGDQRLQLVADEEARRSLLGLSKDNKLYMISVVENEDTFWGPLLADIPVLFNQTELKEKLDMETLLNLDGGSASFFYVKEEERSFMLSELSPIGSLICVQWKKE